MIRNYLKAAWRNLLKNKIYLASNLFGLAVILVCVVDELSYDPYHEKADPIYPINSDITLGENQRLPFTSDMMVPALKQDYPQVEQFVRIYTSSGSKLLRKGAEYIPENRVAHVDSTFYTIFSLPIIAGDPYTAESEIIGVVKNSIGPLEFMLRASTGLTSYKVNAANLPQLLTRMENTWDDMTTGGHYAYRFMDEAFNEMYPIELRLGKTALIFSVLAILVACLGFFGLSTFIAEKPVKESGIRKVLGASVNGLVPLLSREFLKLVLVTFVIATPFAWISMDQWLRIFVYRIEISRLHFAVAVFLAPFIALTPVGYHAIKSAMINPATNSRSEYYGMDLL